MLQVAPKPNKRIARLYIVTIIMIIIIIFIIKTGRTKHKLLGIAVIDDENANEC
jgi:hypothetical protein